MEQDNKLKLLIGGQAIGISDCQLTFKEEDIKKLDEPREGFWRQMQPLSWDVKADALIRDTAKDPFEEFFGKTRKVIEATIMQQLGKLPRKMKKAFKTDPGRCTKWGKKLENYMKRNTYYGRGGEIVLTKAEQDTLTAQLKFDKFERGCDIVSDTARVSGKTIHKVLSRYSKIQR